LVTSPGPQWGDEDPYPADPLAIEPDQVLQQMADATSSLRAQMPLAAGESVPDDPIAPAGA
jgi:hypothetical protein